MKIDEKTACIESYRKWAHIFKHGCNINCMEIDCLSYTLFRHNCPQCAFIDPCNNSCAKCFLFKNTVCASFVDVEQDAEYAFWKFILQSELGESNRVYAAHIAWTIRQYGRERGWI